MTLKVSRKGGICLFNLLPVERGVFMGNKKTMIRHKVRRKLEQCAGLCDNINQHLADCSEPFREANHPAFDNFKMLGTVAEQLRVFILEVREKI